MKTGQQVSWRGQQRHCSIFDDFDDGWVGGRAGAEQGGRDGAGVWAGGRADTVGGSNRRRRARTGPRRSGYGVRNRRADGQTDGRTQTEIT